MDTARTLAGLTPLAIALALYATVIAFVLGRNDALGECLLGTFLIGHGLAHVPFVLPPSQQSAAEESDATWPFDLTRSWLESSGVDATVVRAIGIALTMLVVVGFVLAALATVAVVVPPDAWQALVIGSSIASIALLTIAFSPALALGFAIDAILVVVAVGAVWTPLSWPGVCIFGSVAGMD